MVEVMTMPLKAGLDRIVVAPIAKLHRIPITPAKPDDVAA